MEMEKLRELLWQGLGVPLTFTLIRCGVTRNRRAWDILHRISPLLAGAAVLLEEECLSTNMLIWYYDAASANENAAEIDGMLADIHEMIVRAPAPFGEDEYAVTVLRLSPMAGDELGLDDERIDATLSSRPVLSQSERRGDRYYDWKRGDGPLAIAALLEQVVPDPSAPVTVVRVRMIGRAIARALTVYGVKG